MSKKNLVMLAILDGYGINNNEVGNAIYQAKKPNLDRIFKTYPYTEIGASGEAYGDVRLPDRQAARCEVIGIRQQESRRVSGGIFICNKAVDALIRL